MSTTGAPYALRIVGDPVLRQRATEVADIDGRLARMFQHELDHLDGVLLIDRLAPEQRKDAKRAVRELQLGLAR